MQLFQLLLKPGPRLWTLTLDPDLKKPGPKEIFTLKNHNSKKPGRRKRLETAGCSVFKELFIWETGLDRIAGGDEKREKETTFISLKNCYWNMLL